MSPEGRSEPFTAETAETAEPSDVLCALGELGGEKLLDTTLLEESAEAEAAA